MKLQILQDSDGKNMGVFIPMEDGNLIKNAYPNIEYADTDLSKLEKNLIDTRLHAIAKNPERIKCL